MAEDYIEMETSSKIPVLHRGKEVAVGFNDLGSIQPLDELLSRYFPKKFGKTVDKNLQELSVNVKKYIKLSDIEQKERKVSFDKIASAVNNINNAIKEDRNRKKSSKSKEESNNKAVAAKIVQAVAGATISSLQNGLKRIESLRELESAGVSVAKGFDSLRKSSEDLARPQTQLVKLYTKNSQLLSRLNASANFLNDGVGFFNDTLKSVSGQFNLTRQEEEAILSEYLDTRTKYANIEQLDRERLRKETELYTKNLKQLSMATGKSIDLILQENKLKEDEFAIQALRSANPAMEALEGLLAQQVGPEMARALILNDVTSEKYLGAMATQQGRDYAQLRNMVARNPNMQMEEMISFINASLDRNQTERNRMNSSLVNDALYGSNLVYRPENAALFGQVAVGTRGQKLATYNGESTDSNILKSARNFSDEIERSKIILENLRTQNLENVGKELGFFADKLQMINESVLSPLSRLKDKFSDNFWIDLGASIAGNLADGLASKLLNTVGAMFVTAGTVVVGSAMDGIGNFFGGSGKGGKAGKLGKFAGKAGKMAGKVGRIGGKLVAPMALAYDAYSGIRDVSENGFIGTGEMYTNEMKQESLFENALSALNPMKYAFAIEEMTTKLLNKYGWKETSNTTTPNTVPPAQPSFDSSSNTSASNASTQNAETQRFNATNQVQKDIKEINSLMLDALERIERGQQRQTQQLENIGFMATSKNTGMI
jgi:hypothetical protein|uniref:Uncharacterized protein n=1 Tax=Myoviridae sp. ctWb16 TaxID=2827690 RepID=A0A8S5T0G3_9CAUD|nr:MAG TPA: hypothetical protein [Myoviridae sp. ctWb16]